MLRQEIVMKAYIRRHMERLEDELAQLKALVAMFP